jgi:hypothetical protein
LETNTPKRFGGATVVPLFGDNFQGLQIVAPDVAPELFVRQIAPTEMTGSN